MEKNKPIGVFDSGLGGLTAVKRLRELLVHEDIIYLGDTARVPYGSRSRETIAHYASEDTTFLLKCGVKAIAVACNTVSSTALDAVREIAGDIPVFDVVEPPSAAAAVLSANRKIAVLGTEATVRSGAYNKKLLEIDKELKIKQIPCPLFVPLVENGRVKPNDIVPLQVARDYLTEVIEFGADTVILGCTHYPLLECVLAEVLGTDINFVDSGAELAQSVAAGLRERNLLNDHGGDTLFNVTDSVDGFHRLATAFLGWEAGKVRKVVI